MSYVEQAIKNADEDFKQNFWEMEIPDLTNAKFRIEEASLPFNKFETETLPTGESYFSGIDISKPFTLTIREKADLSVRKFFMEWEESFFKDGAFISQGENVAIGSLEDKIHKDLVLSLFRHKVTNKWGHYLYQYEIKDNAALAALRRTGRNATTLGNEFVPDRISSKYNKSGSKPELPRQRRAERVSSKKLVVENIIRTFTFKHTKLLGIEPVSFNYETGDPLKYNVSFVADYIDEKEVL